MRFSRLVRNSCPICWNGCEPGGTDGSSGITITLYIEHVVILLFFCGVLIGPSFLFFLRFWTVNISCQKAKLVSFGPEISTFLSKLRCGSKPWNNVSDEMFCKPLIQKVYYR